MPNVRNFIAALFLSAALFDGTGGIAHTGALPMERAQMLSAFGERAAFSPDGKRVAFIGKSYGDAYEIELATGRVRSLTANVPHQGFLRVQYLENGDYLLVGPKKYTGLNSRLNVDLFVLDKSLSRGLQPLEQGVFEGVAIGPGNLIAWQQIPAGTEIRDGESWLQVVQRIQPEQYIGHIVYHDGKVSLVEKHRILDQDPTGCGFKEVQDFRDNGSELIFYCGGVDKNGASFMGIVGQDLRTGKYTVYHKAVGAEYAEVEGVSNDGRWAAVECGQRKAKELVPPLDICRLELRPNGQLIRLIIGTAPGDTRKVSNPVIAPDGGSIAFQSANSSVGEIGEGAGIYLMKLSD